MPCRIRSLDGTGLKCVCYTVMLAVLGARPRCTLNTPTPGHLTNPMQRSHVEVQGKASVSRCISDALARVAAVTSVPIETEQTLRWIPSTWSLLKGPRDEAPSWASVAYLQRSDHSSQCLI